MRFHLLRYISFKKVFNVLKLYLGYWLSLLFKKVIVWGYPYSLSSEPTNHCNLHCIECPTGNNSLQREKGTVELKLYEKIIDELKDYILFQMIYFQGEPFLHPDLFSLIRYADQRRIFTCTSTNGHFLDAANCNRLIQSGLKKLIISVDGSTQETYEQYRVGGKLDKVIRGIQRLQETKKEFKSHYPLIYLQFIVFKFNQHQIKEIKHLSRSLGVSKLELKSAHIENIENSSLLPDLTKHSRYRLKNNVLILKHKLLNRCLRIWSTLVITWDGTVAPCCFDKDLEHKMGNVKTTNIIEIWKSERFTDFRRALILDRKKTAMCRNCTEGLGLKNKK